MVTNDQRVDEAVAALSAGHPVVFPTDTVYGLGVAVGIAHDPVILYDIKQRDFGKPVAWLVGGPEDLGMYGRIVPEIAHVLARTFWPGPLTLIVKASDRVPPAFRAVDSTIALRMPDNELALALIRRVGVPLATTSANISGTRPPKSFEDIDARLLDRVPVALKSAGTGSGTASTVVDCSTGHPVVVRQGAITIADIQALG